MRPILVIPVALAVVLSACGGECEPPAIDAVALPFAGDNEVSIDSTPMVYYSPIDQSASEFALVDADGNEIPVTRDAMFMGNSEVVWLSPDADLDEAAQYSVVDGSDAVLTTFTTDIDIDRSVPGETTILSTRVVKDQGPCNAGRQMSIALDPAGNPGKVYTEIEVAWDEAFTDTMTFVSFEDALILGAEGGEQVLPFSRSDVLHVRARTVDLAGNAGEWTAPDEVFGNGCSTLPRGAAGPALLLIAAGAIRRRRRPPGHASARP